MPRLMTSLVIALLYFSTGYLGLYLNSLDGFASLIWFPTGVSIASVYLAGYRVAPAIFTGAFLVNYIWGGSVLLSLIFASGNTLEAAVAVWILRRSGFDGAQLRLSDVWKYMLSATVAGPLISASFGGGALFAFGMASRPLHTFGAWWLGDCMGALVLGFAILIWARADLQRWREKEFAFWVEGAVLGGLTLFMLTWLFVSRSRLDNALPVSYFFFPLVIWCAVRFGHAGVTLQTFALAALGTWGTLHGWGLFAGASIEESLTYFQSYLWMAAAMGLVIASILRERDAAAQSLGAANRAKDDFLAMLSHELRTPLNVILGWTESLSEGADPAALEEGVKTLRRNALVQKNLIDDLLDTSRIIAGKLVLESQDMDLVPLVRDLVQTYKVEAQKRELAIVFESRADSAWIHGDPARIHQVISNLLSNAIKFSLKGGVIDAGVEVSGTSVKVWVKDTGVGIDPLFMDHVFDRFRQESRGTNRQHEGLGLGLAICQYLIKRHGGTIVARSEGKGRGAMFEFILPRVTAPLVAGPAREKAVASAHLRGRKVLLIDDAPDILDLLSFWLKKHAIEVVAAGSVAQAFTVLKTYRPDLIFCDIGMPGEDGYAFIARLKAHHDASVRSIPVAALTAYTEESERIKTLKSGFARHMIKPVTLPRLLTLMTDMLDAGRERSVGAGPAATERSPQI